ncbi:TPA: hypothetical protein ACH3X1_006439 [Trebouxia sp. C0004]
MTPLQGFGFVRNVYELYFPDRLHQSNRGTPVEVARLLEQSLQPAQKKALNGYLSSLPRFPNLKVPSFSLDTGKKTTATKTADLFKVLPVAVLAFASVRATFLEPMQELLEFMSLRDLEQHPDASLIELDAAWKRQLGSANVTSTGYGERSHVNLKEGYRFTNRHGSKAVDKQTLQNVARKATADAIAYAAEASMTSEPESRSKSAAQRACETLKPCLDAGKTGMGYISPADTTCIGQRLGGHPQLLKLFQMAMAKELTSPNAVLPAHINDCPRTNGGIVRVSNGVGVAHQLHRGSSREGVMVYANRAGRRDFVRIKSTGTEVWLAQLQLLFCVSSKKGAPEFAFIRWLTAAAKPARAANLKLKPYKWEVTRIPGIRSNVPKTVLSALSLSLGHASSSLIPLTPTYFGTTTGLAMS